MGIVWAKLKTDIKSLDERNRILLATICAERVISLFEHVPTERTAIAKRALEYCRKTTEGKSPQKLTKLEISRLSESPDEPPDPNIWLIDAGSSIKRTYATAQAPTSDNAYDAVTDAHSAIETIESLKHFTPGERLRGPEMRRHMKIVQESQSVRQFEIFIEATIQNLLASQKPAT